MGRFQDPCPPSLLSQTLQPGGQDGVYEAEAPTKHSTICSCVGPGQVQRTPKVLVSLAAAHRAGPVVCSGWEFSQTLLCPGHQVCSQAGPTGCSGGFNLLK